MGILNGVSERVHQHMIKNQWALLFLGLCIVLNGIHLDVFFHSILSMCLPAIFLNDSHLGMRLMCKRLSYIERTNRKFINVPSIVFSVLFTTQMEKVSGFVET